MPDTPPTREHSAARRSAAARRALVTGTVGALLIALATSRLDAQWVERTVELDAGWNTLWLDAEPSRPTIDALLDGLDWDSIWAPALDSPAVPEGTRWIATHRDGPSFARELEQVCANRAYLVHMRSAGTLRYVGRPVLRRLRLARERHTLAGFTVDAANRPSLDEALAHPSVTQNVESVHGIEGGAVRELSLGDRAEPGRAYWIFPRSDLAELGALRTLAGPAGVDFGERGVETDLELEVPERPFPQFVLVRAVASATPPDGAAPDAAEGAAWLELVDPDGDVISLADPVNVEVPAGTTRLTLRLRAEREAGAREPDGDGGGAGPVGSPPPAENQAVLEIADTDGNRLEIGAVAGFPTLDGLWVGSLVLDEVSVHTDHGGSDFAPAAPFTAGVLLELAPDGAARLLREAEVSVDQDGRQVRRRLRPLLFPDTIELDGAVEDRGRSGTLDGQTTMPADHPLHPFRHRYHPEHREAFALERSVSLTFGTAASGDDRVAALLDVGALVGIYEETLTGLVDEPVRVRGKFRLRRAASSEEVNP